LRISVRLLRPIFSFRSFTHVADYTPLSAVQAAQVTGERQHRNILA
jgi:hypothetical protein